MFDVVKSTIPKPNYEYITREEDARRAMNEIAKYDIIEVDTEGTSLSPFDGKITLFQIGLPNKAYVFDNRSDTEYSDFNIELFKPILEDKSKLKILQNAVYDMKMIKWNHGFYIENIYDTMLVEQLLTLGLYPIGLMFKYSSLKSILKRRLSLDMEKEPRNSFSEYNQKFKPFQLEYAAKDVTVLRLIRDLQLEEIKQHCFEDVCRLEFEFTKPMCEMELNGIIFDVDRQRDILEDVKKDAVIYGKEVVKYLNETVAQKTLFGVSLINIDSNIQLKKALNKYGLAVPDTQFGTLEKYKGVPVIDALLDYRKAQKFLSTYGESLIAKINPLTGRLHTAFTQMVRTGRMSSSNPNLQNIPKKQKYRTCFITKFGYTLITSDMSGAELRILGNLSKDKIFIECYANGIDLHTRTAAEVNDIPLEQVRKDARSAAKAINFGLCYGLSKFGLSKRLNISEKEADEMITKYFTRYSGVKKYLDAAAKNAVRNRFSSTISGRKRFYKMPDWDDPDRKFIVGGIERAAKNAGIQGSNADTIKQAMILLVDRLEKSGYDARLVLTVHDEVVVEVKDEQVSEVKEIVSQSLVDGFGRYFSTIPMEADSLVGPCWLKSACETELPGGGVCGGLEMVFDYNKVLRCRKCGEKI